MLRDQVFVLDHMYMSVFSTCGWILRLGVTMALLVSIHPALAAARGLRAADGADVDVAAGGRARARRSAARRRSRLARHLFTIGDDRAAGQGGARHRHRRRGSSRDRRAGVGALVRGRSRRRAGARRCGTRSPGRSSAPPTSARSCSCRPGSARRPGSVLLVLAAGARLSAYIGATVGEIGFLRGIWMDGSRRLAWLEDYAAFARRARPIGRCRPRSRDGIRLDHVSFAYPGHRRGSCSTTSR